MRYLYTLITVIRHTLTYSKIILPILIPIHTHTYIPTPIHTHTYIPTPIHTHTYTYSHLYILIHQCRLLICITIANGSNNTVGGSCCSAQQAVSRFAEHHIDMVSCVHRKCQTRAGVSGDINQSFECVTITDSKFSNRGVVRMKPKSTSINWVTI